MTAMLDLSLFDQDEIWVDQTGREWRLRDMEPRHRENLIRFLRRGASHFALYYGLYDASRAGAWEALRGGPPDDFDIPTVMDDYNRREWEMAEAGFTFEEIRQRLDRAWLDGTPLMRALVSMVPKERRGHLTELVQSDERDKA